MISRLIKRKNIVPFVAFSFVAVFLITYNFSNYFPRLRTPLGLPKLRFSSKSSTCFTAEVNQFIESAQNESLQLIILEPYLLNDLLSKEERAVLSNNKVLPDVTNCTQSRHVTLITFGVRSHDLIEVKDDYLCRSTFQLSAFSCSPVFGKDGSQRKWYSWDSFRGDITTHYLFHKQKTLIHLVILFERSPHIIWIASIPKNHHPFGIRLNHSLRFGSTEQAFDQIDLRKAHTDRNLTVHVPHESDHFLSQLGSSKFLECNFQQAKRFNAEHIGYSKYLLDTYFFHGIAYQSSEGLLRMKALAKELRIPIWVTDGTLLGWYRECDIVPYTTDMDFGTWSHFATKDMTSRLMQNDHDLKAKQSFGFLDNGYELVFYTGDDLKMDLFFFYESGDNLTTSGHMPWLKSYLYYTFHRFELCSAELLGYKVLVTCDPELYITTEYGPQWTEPIKDWSYYRSPYNRGPMIEWPNDTVGFYNEF